MARAAFLIAIAVTLAACPGPARAPASGACLPAAMQGAPQAAAYAFSLVIAGDWSRFDAEAAMPRDMLERMAAGRPNAFGADPAQLYAVNRQELGSGFQRVHAEAASPLQIDSLRDRSAPGSPLTVVDGHFVSRTGAVESVQIKLVWSGCRFYVGYLG